jgi:hypothetical protein
MKTLQLDLTLHSEAVGCTLSVGRKTKPDVLKCKDAGGMAR